MEALRGNQRLSRRAALGALAILAASTLRPALARPGDKTLPASQSLPDELAAALADDQPLVVMVSLKGCPWCRQVRNNYLAPMHEREALPVVQVDMMDARTTRDVDGTAISHADLLRQWGVKVAPTLLFLGPDGEEVAPRLEGVSENYYASLLDGRLRRARQALADARD